MTHILESIVGGIIGSGIVILVMESARFYRRVRMERDIVRRFHDNRPSVYYPTNPPQPKDSNEPREI